jgi:hypothetical protein
MTEEEKQLLTKCSNSMVSYLTPEELEKYAELEQTEKETRLAKEAMLNEARGRNFVCQVDAAYAADIAELSPDHQEAFRIMNPEELERFSELCMRNAQAFLDQAKFIKMAGARAEAQERGGA